MSSREKFMTLDDFDLPDITVDSAEIERWQSEEQFLGLAIELFKEVGKIGGILGCVMPPASDGSMGYWTRDQAILGGLLVRLTKLHIGFISLVCQHQQELARLLFRSLFETAVNLIYLAEKGTPELYDSYVRYSLRTDKDLLVRIAENVRQRGHELPVEQRMKESVAFMFERSGIDIADINPKERSLWGGSIFQRAKEVGFAEMFLATFGLTSHEVHGNWGDLLVHHLEWSEYGFSPETRWSPSRPQEVLAASLISADALQRYSEKNLPQSGDKDLLVAQLEKYKEKLSLLTHLHEQFLSRGSNETPNPNTPADA